MTSRAQMRRELEYAYDRELRMRRVEPYMSLYRRTEKLPRYWRTPPATSDLSDWSESFHDWYFTEAGGLFLSDGARLAYLSMLEVIATVAMAESSESRLSDEEMERLWRVGQALRRQLAADIGAAEDPRLAVRQPVECSPQRMDNGLRLSCPGVKILAHSQ